MTFSVHTALLQVSLHDKPKLNQIGSKEVVIQVFEANPSTLAGQSSNKILICTAVKHSGIQCHGPMGKLKYVSQIHFEMVQGMVLGNHPK